MGEQKQPSGAGALHVDVRVASLHSNPMGGTAQPSPPYHNNEYYGFTYYHDIQIEPVNGAPADQSPLLLPYERLVESPAPDPKRYGPFQQTILAFTDVLGEDARGQTPKPWGYTQEQLDTFWGDTAFPLFFMSMLNIRHSGELQQVLTLIGESFQDTPHLAYLTFDHCDILLFARGSSFQWQAARIFKLLFATDHPLRDSITLYCFNPNRELLMRQTEKFDAYIKIGIRDYARAELFQQALEMPSEGKKEKGTAPKERAESQKECPELRFGWLLGRNDVALSKRNATLPWLLRVKDEAARLNQPDGDGKQPPSWYTTYELSVLIPEPTDFSFRSLDPKLPERDCGMDTLLDNFQQIYEAGCRRIETKPDRVWLRWLRDAATLSNKLLNDTMTTDLGVCLVPQFLDLLEYAGAAFASPKLTINDIDGVRACFSVFFNNISSLIESTNHSNREFIQVPSFHSVSFEMPPKVMAYYQACGHRIISILHDDNDRDTYGFTISPKFVQELDVASLSLPGITGGRQFLSISVGEKSLYTLHHTTMALAHEFSHFVGRESRLRTVRKEHLVVCCLQTFLEDMLKRFSARLRGRAPSEEEQDLPTPSVKWERFRFYAQELYRILREGDPQWQPGIDNFKNSVLRLLRILPAAIQASPEACRVVRDFLYEGIFCSRVKDKRSDSPTRGKRLGRLYLQLAQYISLRPGFPTEQTALHGSAKELQDSIFLDRLYSELRQLLTIDIQNDWWNRQLSGTAEDNRITVKQRLRIEHYCYLFSETYADLQAILLLGLTRKQYLDQQFIPDTFAGDIALRRLVVTAVLVEKGQKHWEDWEKSEDEHLYRLIGQSVETSPCSFVAEDISPCLFYDLKEYLCECFDHTPTGYDGEKGLLFGSLRGTFSALTDNSSIYQLEQRLVQFINDYADTMPNRSKEVLDTLARMKKEFQQ